MATIKKQEEKKAFVPGAASFTLEGKKYNLLLHAVIINNEKMTAADIAADEKAQKYLVENGCVGSVIAEVQEKKKEE